MCDAFGSSCTSVACCVRTGTAGRTVVYVMPGSRGAVKLGMERLILPELAHLVGQLRRSN